VLPKSRARGSTGVDIANDVPKWQVAVDCGLTRQTENPLSQDVALDLIGATGDRLTRNGFEYLNDDPAEGPLMSMQLRSWSTDERVQFGGLPGDETR
jgi:hypothetical protein